MYGDVLVVAFETSRNAHSINSTNLCHCLPCCCITWCNIFLQVWLNLSSISEASRCPGVLNLGTHPSLRNISYVNWQVVPKSLTITNKSSSASHTVLAVRFFIKYTDGQRVQLSTMHKQYLWPWVDGGSKCPILSMFKVWNGIWFLIMWVIGTLFVVNLSALNWQSWHDMTYFLTDLSRSGQ